MNDLLRGAKKSAEHIGGHLDILALITKSVCLCQYWNQAIPSFHKRSVVEFFQTSFELQEVEWETYEEMLNEFPMLSFAMIGHKFNKVPDSFKLIYQEDRIFSVIYPRTKNEMTEYALCCDLYNFYTLLRKDYSLYKALKKVLIQSVKKYNLLSQPVKMIQKTRDTVPKHLEAEIDSLFDRLNMKPATGVSKTYHHYFETFFKHDLQGYKSDERFLNMMDDALHSYYGAHCDFFITNDDKCFYKTAKTYERLGIQTKVLMAKDFVTKYISGEPF